MEDFKKQIAKHAELDQNDEREFLVKRDSLQNTAQSILF
jgi:hypothetical protein